MSFADDNHRRWKAKEAHLSLVVNNAKTLNAPSPAEWDAAYQQSKATHEQLRELDEWLRRAQILIPDDDGPAAA